MKKYEPWMEKFRHAHKGKRGVRVYYLMAGTGVICSDIAKFVSRGRVKFLDGGWRAAKDCFLTKGQCRRATVLELKDRIESAKAVLQRAMKELRESDARMQGLLNDLEETNNK